jgi:hypothetical protein
MVGAGCSSQPERACTAALARPSVRVDLTAFAAAHANARGELCPTRAQTTSVGMSPCTTFTATSGTIVVHPSTGPGDDIPGHLRVFLAPGDDLLAATGVPVIA